MAAPATPEEAAEAISSAGGPVRISGGATKSGWGNPASEGGAELSMRGMARIHDHAEGDFTAVLDAGVPFAEAQETFARAGQMLALDPPPVDGATVGGVVSAAESGPLRHRYGAPRDLVIGVTLALADGSVAKAGGKVIKNVAGYDVSKLVAGAHGTLGAICVLSLRLHPKPERTATAILRAGDPGELARRAVELAGKPLECEALDARWDAGAGEGSLLLRFAGETCRERAEALGFELASEADNERLWAEQRSRQRAEPDTDEVVVRVAGLPTQLATVISAATEHGGSVVSRAAVGTSYVRLPAASSTADGVAAVESIRAALRPARCTVTDAPEPLRAALDPWDVPEGPELELMRAVKRRFDPDGRLNPGIYVGGI
ncbi:FAD-binding oxidoreductase [Thermoleophilia bacterium SCSIO 60948]|nr:FAD-binding oxidoreductase [Thermoleophilia bacterium SCSIO 60948]